MDRNEMIAQMRKNIEEQIRGTADFIGFLTRNITEMQENTAVVARHVAHPPPGTSEGVLAAARALLTQQQHTIPMLEDTRTTTQGHLEALRSRLAEIDQLAA